MAGACLQSTKPGLKSGFKAVKSGLESGFQAGEPRFNNAEPRIDAREPRFNPSFQRIEASIHLLIERNEQARDLGGRTCELVRSRL